uniref:SH3_10 domain-containing protein n=2 Tax=Caenorhabditis tropicalis TaxID=1561998 RepID=A0A1I7UX10_9PELO
MLVSESSLKKSKKHRRNRNYWNRRDKKQANRMKFERNITTGLELDELEPTQTRPMKAKTEQEKQILDSLFESPMQFEWPQDATAASYAPEGFIAIEWMSESVEYFQRKKSECRMIMKELDRDTKTDVPKLIEKYNDHRKDLQNRMEILSRLELRRMSFDDEEHPAKQRASECMDILSNQVSLAKGLLQCMNRHTMDINVFGSLASRRQKVKKPFSGIVIADIEGFVGGSNVTFLENDDPLEWTVQRNGQSRNLPSVYIQV